MGIVVLVRPEVPENLGFVARLCGNFGFDLRVVDPCFDLGESRETAANCQDILDSVEIFDSLGGCIGDLDFVVGTKPDRGISLSDFGGVSRELDGVGLVFGPESRGLSNRELDLCDAVVHIGTGSGYSSLNLSHAVGIVLYEFAKTDKGGSLVDSGEKEFLEENLGGDSVLFELLVRSGIGSGEFDRLVSELKNLDF